jgi:lipoprotein-releasing system permease protein
MGFESFIARRYLVTKRKARFISIITLLSVIGITIGVAALIIVLSVFNGFNSLVTDILVSFDPHLRIEAAEGGAIPDYGTVSQVLETDKRIAAFSPAVSGRAMMIVRNINRIITVRGVEQDRAAEISGLDESLVLGRLYLNRPDGSDGIVLGIGLADRLNAMIGDSVTIISPVGMEAALTRFGQPVVRRYVVSGIYESRNQDYDSHYAFVSISSARRLFNLVEDITGVEIRLHNFQQSNTVKKDLLAALGAGYSVHTWYDLHRDLYSIMEIERWAAYIILSLIIAVATFNILGSLTMTVIEKRRDIGVLKSMGATNREIVRIYLLEGILVGLIGSILGSILGYLVCYVQIHYHVFPLDPTVYIIPALPVKIQTTDFFTVGGAALLLSSIAALYPARRAARISPAEAIRWE